jgi:hypothetical protein
MNLFRTEICKLAATEMCVELFVTGHSNKGGACTNVGLVGVNAYTGGHYLILFSE